MTITPLFVSRLIAKLIPADPAEGAVTLGFQEIDQNPPAPGFLATARLSIPSSGSVEFDFRKFALIGLAGRADAEGRKVDFNSIHSLAVHSSLPLAVTPGSLPWENSPLPASIHCLAFTGGMVVFADSRSIVFDNPSGETAAELTIVAIGENTLEKSFTWNGVPITWNGVPLSYNPA